jgi:hypothetical protein
MIISKIVVFQDSSLEKKMFFFKMFIHWERYEFDLVKQMLLGGSLQTTWIMFDCVKHVRLIDPCLPCLRSSLL